MRRTVVLATPRIEEPHRLEAHFYRDTVDAYHRARRHHPLEARAEARNVHGHAALFRAEDKRAADQRLDDAADLGPAAVVAPRHRVHGPPRRPPPHPPARPPRAPDRRPASLRR